MGVWLPKKSPVWSGDGVEGKRSEGTSSLEYYEHNVGNLALEVVRQNWSTEVISLFLEDWKVGRVALSCHLAMDLPCQEMRDVCWGLAHCVPSARNEGGGVLMRRFFLPMSGLAYRLGTVFEHFVPSSEWVPFFHFVVSLFVFAQIRRSNGWQVPPFEERGVSMR